MADPPVLRPGRPTTPEALAVQALDDVTAPAPSPAAPVPTPPKSPEEVYQAALADAGLSPAEANSILDAIARPGGYYEREYHLWRGRLRVTFRSRDGYAQQRLFNTLDTVRSGTDAVYGQTAFRIRLAGALVKFNDTPTSSVVMSKAPTSEERERAFAERLAFCDNLIPEHVMPALSNALSHFDKICFAALTEGAAQVF